MESISHFTVRLHFLTVMFLNTWWMEFCSSWITSPSRYL